MRKLLRIILVGSLLLNVTNWACAETDTLSALGSPDYKTRLDALKSLERLPVDNPEIYDLIEMNLMKGYATGGDSRHIDEMAWICKALAASGRDQYEISLAKVVETTDNSKLKRHCLDSLSAIKKNVEDLKQLSGEPIAGYSAEMSKYIRMLQSGRSSWMKTAVLNIEKSDERNEKVFDMVRDVLLAEVDRIGGDDSLLSDANRFKRMYEVGNLGYLCHCLGTSGISKYKTDLQKVIDQTVNISLKAHARKAIDALESSLG